jgi:hypothetical protein
VGRLSDALEMYSSLASAALRRCGQDPRRLRRTLAGFESELANASTSECREGFARVIGKLKEKLSTWPELPMDHGGGT